jgi:hypothetical protein
MSEHEGPPVEASYIRFLDHFDSGRKRRATPPRPNRGESNLPALALPRRRDAKQTLRVRVTDEQLYWLRLAAARAGGKVDESAIVAAGLALLERLAIDWRVIGSRTDLAKAMTGALERESWL